MTDPTHGLLRLVGQTADLLRPQATRKFSSRPARQWRRLPNVQASFAHEGRIPPLLGTTASTGALGGFTNGDNRADPQSGINLGDNSAGVLRLRRVWDSWSTDYSFAPSAPTDPFFSQAAGNPPTYPSYPPPYEQPLRAIQIRIRLADPRGQYAKALTIRQDFTDQL